MTIYVVKKHQGQWAVCARNGALVAFDCYDDAIETARLAAAVITEHALKEDDDAQRADRAA